MASQNKEGKQRLGDILIDRGILTKAELDQAVQCQILFGGRLGTNLLELDHVSEEELIEILVEKYGVDVVGFDDLKEIPGMVVHQIPTEFAIKNLVIPCRVWGSNIKVAMMDPDNRQVIGEIALETGLTVHPAIALEVYLRWALEKYYGCKRDARFINLERSLSLRRELKHSPPSLEPAASPGDSLWKGSQSLPSVPPQVLLPDPQDITSVEGAPKSLEDFWERVGRTSHPHHMIPKVIRELKAAANRDEVSEVLLDYAHRLIPRVALFFIKSGVVFGWDGRGERLGRSQVSGIMIPLELPSVFKTVHEAGSSYLGPVPDNPINQRFLAAMGGFKPRAALLVPVSVFNRVVCILYGDMGSRKDVTAQISDLQPVVVEVGRALARLIKESKATTKDPEKAG